MIFILECVAPEVGSDKIKMFEYYGQDGDFEDMFDLDKAIFRIVKSNNSIPYECSIFPNLYTLTDYEVVKEGNLVDIGYLTKEEYVQIAFNKFEYHFHDGMCQNDFITNLHEFMNIIKLYKKLFNDNKTFEEIIKLKIFKYSRRLNPFQ